MLRGARGDLVDVSRRDVERDPSPQRLAGAETTGHEQPTAERAPAQLREDRRAVAPTVAGPRARRRPGSGAVRPRCPGRTAPRRRPPRLGRGDPAGGRHGTSRYSDLCALYRPPAEAVARGVSPDSTEGRAITGRWVRVMLRRPAGAPVGRQPHGPRSHVARNSRTRTQCAQEAFPDTPRRAQCQRGQIADLDRPALAHGGPPRADGCTSHVLIRGGAERRARDPHDGCAVLQRVTMKRRSIHRSAMHPRPQTALARSLAPQSRRA